MPYDTTRQEYADMLPSVTLVRDCVSGSATVKSKGKTYLPLPHPDDTPWYEAFKQRACFVNFTGRTLHGFLGMASRRKHTIELPAALEPIRENADGAGKPLDEMIVDMLSELMVAGSATYVCDYPSVSPEVSLADEVEMGAFPRFKRYYFEDRINWRDSVVGGQTKTILTVLKEAVFDDSEDEFDPEVKYQYRVLSLNPVSYRYEYKIIDGDDGSVKGPFVVLANDKRLKEIPAVTIGAESNDSRLDKPMLLDIAEININHYINSADFEDASHMSCQGFMIVDTGQVNSQQFIELNPNGVQFGSRRGLVGQGFKAQLLQMNENSQPMEGMTKKEEQMRAIAAKMITPNTAQETAEAARIDAASEISQLETLVSNVESGLERLLRYACLFVGADPEQVSVKLNREFYPDTMSPQEATMFMLFLDRGVADKKDARDRMARAGMVDPERTLEEINDESIGVEFADN